MALFPNPWAKSEARYCFSARPTRALAYSLFAPSPKRESTFSSQDSSMSRVNRTYMIHTSGLNQWMQTATIITIFHRLSPLLTCTASCASTNLSRPLPSAVRNAGRMIFGFTIPNTSGVTMRSDTRSFVRPGISASALSLHACSASRGIASFILRHSRRYRTISAADSASVPAAHSQGSACMMPSRMSAPACPAPCRIAASCRKFRFKTTSFILSATAFSTGIVTPKRNGSSAGTSSRRRATPHSIIKYFFGSLFTAKSRTAAIIMIRIPPDKLILSSICISSLDPVYHVFQFLNFIGSKMLFREKCGKKLLL